MTYYYEIQLESGGVWLVCAASKAAAIKAYDPDAHEPMRWVTRLNRRRDRVHIQYLKRMGRY